MKKLTGIATENTTEIANDKSVYDHNKKIVLNRHQAWEVFWKLYDLFESKSDFKKIKISIK